MRRGVAGLMFFIAAICLAVAAGGWWLQRIAFDTTLSAELAEVVLEDPLIRKEIAEVAAEAAATSLGQPVQTVRDTVDQVAQTSDGAELMEQIVADSHARVIGLRAEPVEISTADLVQITRDQRAAGVPAVVLPVEEVRALSITRMALDWAVPITAIAGGLALLVGLIAHPSRLDAVFGVGTFCILAAVVAMLVGWALPVHAVPAINDSPWLLVIPAVAEHNLPFVIIVSAVLFVGGLLLMFSSAAARRRRVWSAPISVHRYGDQHRWS